MMSSTSKTIDQTEQQTQHHQWNDNGVEEKIASITHRRTTWEQRCQIETESNLLFTFVSVDDVQKRFAIIGEFSILNQTDVLSALFRRRSREDQRFGENVLGMLCRIFVSSLEKKFVLFRIEDDRIRSKDLLNVEFFQPLESIGEGEGDESKRLTWIFVEGSSLWTRQFKVTLLPSSMVVFWGSLPKKCSFSRNESFRWEQHSSVVIRTCDEKDVGGIESTESIEQFTGVISRVWLA